MEKEFLKGKTPDGTWLVTVVIDVDNKIKRIHFEKVAANVPDNPKNLEDPEWDGVKDLLL